jgi:hypothetical protein
VCFAPNLTTGIGANSKLQGQLSGGGARRDVPGFARFDREARLAHLDVLRVQLDHDGAVSVRLGNDGRCEGASEGVEDHVTMELTRLDRG